MVLFEKVSGNIYFLVKNYYMQFLSKVAHGGSTVLIPMDRLTVVLFTSCFPNVLFANILSHFVYVLCQFPAAFA